MKTLFISITPISFKGQGNWEYSAKIMKLVSANSSHIDCIFQSREQPDVLKQEFNINSILGAPGPKVTLGDKLTFRAAAIIRFFARHNLAPKRLYETLCHYSPEAMISQEMSGQIKKALKHQDYDLVISNYLYALPIIERHKSKASKTMVITHDLMHLLPSMSLSENFPILKRAMSAKTELETLDKADYICSISADETAFLARHLDAKKIFTLSWPIVDKEHHQSNSEFVKDNTVVFVGSGNTFNVSAMQHFIQSIWPDVRRETKATLHIIGNVCSHLFVNDNSIVLHSLVPEETKTEIIQMAGAIVNPVQHGTGLNVKTIESIMMNKPVLGFKKAYAGFPNERDYQDMIADNDKELSRLIIERLAQKTDYGDRIKNIQDDLAKQTAISVSSIFEEA